MVNNKHNHQRISIKEELKKREEEWTALSESAKELKSIIDTNYPQHKALIQYLDNENLL
jgi:hypothetical protein